MSDQKKILITSALPYVNNIPHLGNLIGAVLSADVYARFSRLMDRETLYICGSDEHGTATETKALEEGVTPQELCDKYYAVHKEIYEWFNISFDHFGRTSLENHHTITQDLFNKVVANGFIDEDVMIQPYSEKSHMFLADRFVEGTCPHCGYESARGDQCDNCGKLLNPQELIDPKSAVDGSVPIFKETKHLFLRLDKLQPILESWFEKASAEGKWSSNAIQITKNWFKEGLKKRAITRDLKWGIKIPRSAFGGQFHDKVFYVWFDAPIGYISLTEQLREDYESFWKSPQDTRLIQFMGKDNIPFHSIVFPAVLTAASNDLNNPDYTVVNTLSTTEYLNYEGTKFSKSRGVGVFGTDAVNSGIPSDVYRYTLLFYRPEQGDTQFTWQGLAERLNNELVANFGNLVNRTLTFIKRFFDGNIIAISEDDMTDLGKEYFAKFKEEVDHYISLLDEIKLKDALIQFMKISSLCNQFFQEAAPWKSRTEHEDACKKDLALLANMVYDLAVLCQPYMPTTSQEVYAQLNISHKQFNEVGNLSLGEHTIGEPKVLFQKIEDEQVTALKEKFAGEQQVEEVKQAQPSLCVGKIIEITEHPKADKLYIEQVDLGYKKIQIVSGLVPFYKKEELLGKNIIVVANLKPAKLRGEMSEGMLLAAETKTADPNSENGESEIVAVITAPDAMPGTFLSVDGREMKSEDELTFDDFMKVELDAKGGKLLVNGKEATADEGPIVIDKGLVDGKVR